MTMGTSWIAPRGASRVGAAEAPGLPQQKAGRCLVLRSLLHARPVQRRACCLLALVLYRAR